MGDEGGTEMAKKRRDVEEKSVNRSRKRLKRDREKRGKENERGGGGRARHCLRVEA